jgi:hypothetical protein
MSVVLCLLALTIQLVASVVHMLELRAQQEVIVLEALASPLAVRKTHRPTALASADQRSQPLPHDAKACLICQTLAHNRDGLIPQAEMTSAPTMAPWPVLSPVLPPVNLHLGVVSTRAPPFSRS